MSRKSWKAILRSKTPEAEAPQGMEQADLSDMLGGQRVQTDAAVDPESFYGGHVSCDGCRRNRGSAGRFTRGRKNAGKPSQEDEEDEVLFLHQGNDERKSAVAAERRGYLSRICVSAGSIKNDQKAGNTSRPEPKPGGAGREKRASGDGMRRLHDGYEKPVTAARAAQKKRRKRCGTDLKPVPGSGPQPIEKAEQPACKDTVQNDRSGDGENFRTDAEDLSFFLYSIAGAATELAKPVMGTNAPAPPHFAIFG